MSDVKRNVLEAVGNTPLVQLNRLVRPGDAQVLAKVEFMNPGGSVKDRMALHIIEQAERSGALKPGSVIVENTSGNTGVGVAMAAAVKGYRCIFTMPDKMSREKVRRLRAYGAEVVVTPTAVPADHPDSYYETAKRIFKETPNAFMLNQYHNKLNIEAHYHSTGPEIWRQTGGSLDYFVAGIGTGGTMSGAAKYLKEMNPDIRTIGVDPEGSIYYDQFHTGVPNQPHTYKVEGIGEDMVCDALEFDHIDDVMRVTDAECFHMTRRLCREEGIFAGGSSGGAVQVAVDLARELGQGRRIVVLLPDSGAIYLSTFYDDQWMEENGFMVPKRHPKTIADLVRRKSHEVFCASMGEKVGEVALRMRQKNVSQMPVVDGAGTPIAMVHESDLLDAVLRELQSATIEEVAKPIKGLIEPNASIDELRQILAEDHVAIVVMESKVHSIITKIDLIDFLNG